MKMVNKKTLYIGMIALGVALIVFTVLVGVFRVEELKGLGVALSGPGAVLITLFSMYLYNYNAAIKHPEAYRKKMMAASDERSVIVNDKAMAYSNIAMIGAIMVALFVFALIDAGVYLIDTLAVLLVIDVIFFVVFRKYFNKRL